ncbi:hypothetical protein MASR2M18_19500 [Ignavibacteria bacterium]|nr:type VI secretion system tip protein VgrG [Bacteroidota bacterium]MCZ2131835.1 type VI secretion system tip protein VgrG [Bacteroidota bacterium]
MAEEQNNAAQDPEERISAANESVDDILSRLQGISGMISEAERRLEETAQTVGSIGDGLDEMRIAALDVTGLADLIPGLDSMLPAGTPISDAIAAAADSDGEEPVYLQFKTPFGAKALHLQRITGDEHISALFRYTLETISEDDDLDFDAIVGKQVTVSIMLADGAKRYINGYVSRFAHGGNTVDHTYYFAEVVPWLWILTLTQNSRIFQEKSVVDIITQVFDEFDFAEYRNATKATYQPREYCVQYRETAFNFISRLMEEEGIFYYFEHTEDKHTLVLADDVSVHESCAGLDKARFAPSRRSGH